ncbi:MAG TPA: FAD-dependent oxidoreductase [Oligoflexia bacterium]|nr:FAD-dependent oxidoreductase [Oligoflexia bacterium]HMP47777.1 FAD-dependent oxidoreductase [Oligoflexia bacterium]
MPAWKRKPSSKTPLFQILSKAADVRKFTNDHPELSIDEAIKLTRSKQKVNRREFLKSFAAAGALAGATPLFSACSSIYKGNIHRRSDARIVIIGAGMAGLNCARHLEKSGITSSIYESSKRSGGRMYSTDNLIGKGITTEIGGEFIDSSHEDILSMVLEFGLELIDTHDDPLKSGFYFNNTRYTEEDAIKAFIPIAEKIEKDSASLGDNINYQSLSDAKKFDEMNIAEYLDKIGANGWIRSLLEVAYVTEYGLDIEQQSALNLVQLISTDTENGFHLFGDSDERFKIRGGNELLVKAIAKDISSPIHLEHRLESIRMKSGYYELHFSSPGNKCIVVPADIVICTMPFSTLRLVDFKSLSLSPLKQKCISELGYGTNAKLFCGYSRRIWREYGLNGNTQSDESYQLLWDNSQLQPGIEGGLTFYSGGRSGVEVGTDTPKSQIMKILPGVEKTFPGSSSLINNIFERFHWPSHAHTLGSYAAYLPGQWTTFAGSEILPEGNLFFAGEHCSYEFQGFMNGAAETGRKVAEVITGKTSL